MIELEIWQLLLLMVSGIIAGFINVMAGGGSLLTVPIMVFMGLPGAVANGTNRVALLAQNVSASLKFFKSGFSNFKLSISLGLCTIPGAIVGASIGAQLNGPWFNRVLAVVMFLVLILMATNKKGYQQSTTQTQQQRRKGLWLGHLLMIGIGFYGGFIQLGVGLLLMPILHRVMGLSLVEVNMHKVFIVLIYTIVALFVYASQLQIAWMIGACLAVGNALGGWLGATFTITKGERLIKTVLYVVLILFIVKLLLDS